MLAEGRLHRKLATRGDVYDILPSPEKVSSRPPKTQPFKVGRKKAVVDAQAQDVSMELPSSAQDEPTNELQMPSSPPALALPVTSSNAGDLENLGKELPKTKGTPQDVLVEETLPSGKPRCSAVYYRYDKHMGPRHQQCSNVGTNRAQAGLRCKIHLRKLLAVRCGHVTVTDNVALQCHKVATKGAPSGGRCAEHVEDQHVDTSDISRHTGAPDQQSAIPLEQSQSTKSQGQKATERVPTSGTQPLVQLPVRQSTKPKNTAGAKVMSNPHITHQEDGPQTVNGKRARKKMRMTQSTYSRVQDQPMDQQQSGYTTNESARAQPIDTAAITDDADNQVDVAQQDFDAHEHSIINQPSEAAIATTMDQVFNFLDLEERSGKCQTDLGLAIERMCKQSCRFVQSEDISIDALDKDFENNQGVINQVHTDIETEDRLAFKSDAYGYLFRHLALYLEAVYSWLNEHCDVLTESLVAMHILVSLIHDILALKATIAKWKVPLPERSKGDRMVRDVESIFIVPLRRAERLFGARLARLQAAERISQQDAVLKRKREEDADEERRRAETMAAKRERWTRWQNLHILRMQCEPDPFRRKMLVITKFEDLEEKDANGFKFERLPVFKSRSSPPLFWASALSEDRQWSDAEEVALLESLQRFAGTFLSIPASPPCQLLMRVQGPVLTRRCSKHTVVQVVSYAISVLQILPRGQLGCELRSKSYIKRRGGRSLNGSSRSWSCPRRICKSDFIVFIVIY